MRLPVRSPATKSTLVNRDNPIKVIATVSVELPVGTKSLKSATMLAAHHEQENIYTHHAGTTKQQLQAKAPGARFPKTPLKVPLNDENVQNGFSGKSGLRTKGNNENTATVMKGGNGLGKAGKSNLVTPAGEVSLHPLLLRTVHLM